MSNSSRTLALTALLAAAPAGAKLMEDTVAVVNGTPILLSEYQKELATALDYWAKMEPEAMSDPTALKKLRESTLEELVNRELLYQEGTRLKIKVRERDVENGVSEIKSRFLPADAKELPEHEAQAKADAAFKKQLDTDGLSYDQFRERLSKQIMARKLIDESVRARMRPPEAKEVEEYFERLKTYIAKGSSDVPKGMDEESGLAFRQIALQVKAMTSERVRLSRILVKISQGASDAEKKRALKAAQEIRKRLVDGTSTFAEVAKAESEDGESAPRGGDLGYVVRGVAPPDLEKVAFTMPLGEVSEPILTDLGYHIIRVSEKRAAETPEFDKFKEDLGKFLMNMTFQRELETYVKSLKTKAVIERNPAHL